MKKNLIIPLFTFTFALHLAASAAVPLHWTVETTRAQPATFEAYQGETLAFEAALTSRGKPLELSGLAAFYWQTNGMGSAYWESTAAVNSNRLSAVFTPEMDVGAKVYNCFIGVPGTIYHAAFQLRLRPSPGALPNVLPLPVPVIDFAKVLVLNPPWSGGGGGVNTNAVRDIIHATVDGAARPLPKYLHLYDANDSYPDEAQEYYRSRGNGTTDGGCSSVRDGWFLYRNFDYPFDDRAEFVVRMSAGVQTLTANGQQLTAKRFASVGVAQVGTNLTEAIVTSGKPSRCYKWLPGATVDGINENGVACNINVVDGDPQTSGWHNDTGDLHPLAAIRWILDNATNAQHAAEYIASHIRFPQGWTQNFHWMVADERETWIVENGTAVRASPPGQDAVYDGTPAVLTNFRVFYPNGSGGWLYDPRHGEGAGSERADDLVSGGARAITNVWYTRAYSPETSWLSDFGGSETLMATSKVLWAQKPKEAHRGETFEGHTWWQTVHTSVYDISNRFLRVSVQETDDWYTFKVPSSGAKIDAYTKAETDEKLAEKVERSVHDNDFDYLDGEIEGLKNNKANRADPGDNGELATLDEDGNPTRSGKTADDFLPSNSNIDIGEHSISAYSAGLAEASIGTLTTADIFIQGKEFDGNHVIVPMLGVYFFPWASDYSSAPSEKKFVTASMISATDPTFSNAVAEVAKKVTPTPTGTLRLFDPVLNRWVILKSVNMNLTLEVE